MGTARWHVLETPRTGSATAQPRGPPTLAPSLSGIFSRAEEQAGGQRCLSESQTKTRMPKTRIHITSACWVGPCSPKNQETAEVGHSPRVQP